MYAILLVGADQSLLRTRAAVLRSTGCSTICGSAASALGMLEDCRPQLVVLCHTLPPHVGTALTRTIHEKWPGTRVMQVLSRCHLGMHPAAAYTDAVTSSEPDRLVRCATHLLRLYDGLPQAAYAFVQPLYPN